jgi:hypothetical protein
MRDGPVCRLPTYRCGRRGDGAHAGPEGPIRSPAYDPADNIRGKGSRGFREAAAMARQDLAVKRGRSIVAPADA